MGLCVIGSEVGGLKETIGSGGHSCRAGSSWALFKMVEKVILNSNPNVEAKQAIFRAQNFTIERMREEYAEVISQIFFKSAFYPCSCKATF